MGSFFTPPLSLPHLRGDQRTEPGLLLAFRGRGAALDFRLTKGFRNVAGIGGGNSHHYLLCHHRPFLVGEESSPKGHVFPADTSTGPLPSTHLHQRQESVQDVHSQNKRFCRKSKKAGQAPEIFHLGIPLPGTQTIFTLR